MSRRPRRPALIAVDGIDGAVILRTAKAANAAVAPAKRGGISRWDASGVFQELLLAGREAGRPSARTMLLLYAADLAFRLRWEIRPALAEGRAVVAAPYVDTAVAFGRAAGLPAAWLASLFRFAPKPSERIVNATVASPAPGKRAPLSTRRGFVELACGRAARPDGIAAADLADRTRACLLKRRAAPPR